MHYNKAVTSALRYSMGFIFLWAFIDKTFGLGFATKSASAWIAGGSPTYGFLTFAAKGPLAGFFQSLAGVRLVDWAFMLGLLFVGGTLRANKFVRWGALAGSAMLALMYLALLLPENNPLIDDHIIYMLVLAHVALHSDRS